MGKHELGIMNSNGERDLIDFCEMKNFIITVLSSPSYSSRDPSMTQEHCEEQILPDNNLV